MTKFTYNALTALSVACLVSWSSAQADSEIYSGPAGGLSEKDNQALWEQYCEGYTDLSRAPGVRYDNALVLKATRNISTMSDYSIYYYSGPLSVYGLKGNSIPELAVQAGTNAGF